jgi:hypothetical protein
MYARGMIFAKLRKKSIKLMQQCASSLLITEKNVSENNCVT